MLYTLTDVNKWIKTLPVGPAYEPLPKSHKFATQFDDPSLTPLPRPWRPPNIPQRVGGHPVRLCTNGNRIRLTSSPQK